MTLTMTASSLPAETDGVPWDQLASAFGATLGLDGPVPRPTLEAALADETYADNLLASRRHPVLLQQLIDAPPRPRAGAQPRHSPLALARNASLALARWAAVGFTTVSEAERRQREAACLACPHRLASDVSLGHCGLCGCPLGRKTRMSSETCPGPHPSLAGQTRWGGPLTAESPAPA